MIANRDQILEAMSIVDVCDSLGIEYKRGGSHYFIRCPEHMKNLGHIDNKIGNCRFNKKNKGYVCESCGAHGSTYDLIMNYFHCNFQEAIEQLSNLTGVPIVYVEEGQTYIRQDGTQSTFVDVISRSDQEFLGLYNDSVIVSDFVSDDADELKRQKSLYINQDRGVILKTASTNPLRELAEDDYESYQELIRNKVLERYQIGVEFANKLKNTEWETACNVMFAELVFKLKDIYLSVGGNADDISFNTKSSGLTSDIPVDLKKFAF